MLESERLGEFNPKRLTFSMSLRARPNLKKKEKLRARPTRLQKVSRAFQQSPNTTLPIR
jgi:hypothetical protein